MDATPVKRRDDAPKKPESIEVKTAADLLTDKMNNTETIHIRPVKMDGRTSATTSSRAAANLSLERLYRKRAIDRENQRVLRQKNKARLAELEQEVKTLTAKLEKAEAEKALQVAKTQDSTASIDSIISSLRSLQLSLGQLQQTTPPPTLVTMTAIPSPLASSASPAHSHSDGGGGGISSVVPMAEDSPTHSSPERTLAETAAAATQQYQQSLGLDSPDFRCAGASVIVPVDDFSPFSSQDFSLNLDLLTRNQPLFQSDMYDSNNDITATTTLRRTSSSYGGFSGLPSPTGTRSTHHHHRVDFEASAPPRTAAGDRLRRSPHDDTGPVDLARREANRLRDASPLWAATPSYVPPTCNVDELIINLVYKRREELKRRRQDDQERRKSSVTSSLGGGSGENDEFGHAHFPSVSSLLNPVLYEPDKPVASTIARHVAGTVMVFTTPEKAALLYIMCVFIRWLISPTKEHYDSIPEFFRPTGAQLVVPHPFWIDTIGWPRARERLVRHFDFTQYRGFASVIVQSFSIGWPHSDLEGILEGTPEKGFVMTRAFVQHVREPANWTVGPELVEAFPFLDGAVNVRGLAPVSF